jgi:hypothetical protein
VWGYCIDCTQELSPWRFNSDDHADPYVTSDPNRVTQPDYLVQYSDGQDHLIYDGMPYCWGGWDDISEFFNNVYDDSPYYAGNIHAYDIVEEEKFIMVISAIPLGQIVQDS